MADLTIQCNEQYARYAPRWIRTQSVIDGEARLKEIDLARVGVGSNPKSVLSRAMDVAFLRLINPSKNDSYNNDRNAAMINGAVLFNFTVKTQSGLMGMLYRKPPAESNDIPSELEYIYKNVNGAGLTMAQQSRSVALDVVSIGRSGLLVDMPRNADGVTKTKADVDAGYRATIQEYKAAAIWDWHESVINGVKMLDLLVLIEQVEVFTDEMRINRETKNQFKVYRLDADGVTVQTYISEDEQLLAAEVIDVKDPTGAKLKEIPFTFVGSTNNQPAIDRLPLEPISNLNIGHYQESANLASSSFRLGHPQPWVASNNYMNLAKERAKAGGAVELGDNAMVVVEQGGAFGFATAPENTMSRTTQKGYEEQAVAAGAAMITNSSGNETVEAAKIRGAATVSDVQVMGGNISAAYTKCIEWVCLMMGIEYKDYSFMLNDEFFDTKLSADDAVKMVSVWQGGAISKAVLDYNLQQGKVIAADEDLELMNQAIDDEAGDSLDFDGDTPTEDAE